jgi:outer membrane protein OmpA-like peptidoglycan-associated protein
MKKLFILSVALLGLSSTSNGQILDSLQAGAGSVQFQVLAPSNYEDFSAAPYGDKLLFVSSRETSLFSKRDRGNNQRYFDLYLYDLKTGEVSRYGDQLSSLEKSKFHLGPATLLPDSAGVILSRNYRVPNLKDEVNFYLVYENWKTNEKYTLPFCSMANSFQHPFYDAKRRRLYFTSNMPGGPGGYDIYFSELLKDNSWGDPVLVEGVNGPRDDVFPTVSNDGTLYFSRTESQMGLNLFSFENGEVAAFNAPLTTSRDEFSIIEIGRDSAVFSQSQKGRFNTDLVLAWIDSGSDTPTSIVSTSTASEKDKQPELPETEQTQVIQSTNQNSVADVTTDKVDDAPVAENTSTEQTTLIVSDSSKDVAVEESNETDGKQEPIASSEANNHEEESVYVQAKQQESADDAPSYAVAVPFTGSASSMIKGLSEKGMEFSNPTDAIEIDGQWYLILSPFTADENELVAFESSYASQNLEPLRVKRSEVTSVANQELNKKWYSVIASSHNDFQKAVESLSQVSVESDNAYISLYEGRYYVVLAFNTDSQSASALLKEAEEKGLSSAFLMTELLAPMRMPNLIGSPDLVVYFEFDKTYVQEKHRAQIDKVIANLPAGRDKVYLVGHTDSRGPNEYNVPLGMRRAKSVAEYIGDHHESFETSEDLHSKGEFELTNKCEDGVECDEYAHFLNRRVEIWFY